MEKDFVIKGYGGDKQRPMKLRIRPYEQHCEAVFGRENALREVASTCCPYV
jgi:hypothetical protein